MKQPIHALSAAPSRWTPERIAAVGFVGLLHVVVIYAFVTGLAQRIVHGIPPVIDMVFPHEHDKPLPPVKPPEIPTVKLQQQDVDVPPPDFKISTPDPSRVGGTTLVQPTNPPVNIVARAIASTHTTPDYPPIARRLGEQGKVILRLTISPQGTVSDAEVVQSSGYDDLDRAAVSWVIAHWRYTPAVRDGSPAESQTNAAVVFNLRNAG